MTPSGSGPRSTAVRRRVASGCLDHDHGRTRYVVGRLTRRQLRSWTVRLRAAHLLVAVRLGEWWDDALACLPAGAGSGGPTCLLYTSDAADEEDSVDLGGRR